MDIRDSLVAGGATVLTCLLYFDMLKTFFMITAIVVCSITFVVLRERLSVSRSQADKERVSQPESLKSPLRLDLLIDKSNGRVILAECEKNFVDVLLSFLLLPLGKIIMVLDKKSGISSMDELYKSVEALDPELFGTKACKNMLLKPRSAYGLEFSNLAVKIDPTDYTEYYTCSSILCMYSITGRGFVSLVENSTCCCGRAMNTRLHLNDAERNAHYAGGFVTSAERYMVTDDLRVMRVSIDKTYSLLQRAGFGKTGDVLVKNVNIGVEEVLQLLRGSLLSKTPLTDIFLSNVTIARTKSHDWLPKTDQYSMIYHVPHKKMSVELWFSQSAEKIFCAVAEADFIDFLLSLLTLPLGSISKILPGSFSLGSIDNLYHSVTNLNSEGIVSKESTLMLLNPKLERMFGCENRLLDVDEDVTARGFLSTPNGHFLRIVNPKCPGPPLPKRKAGFVRQRGLFLVTDSLLVEPFSSDASLKKLGILFSDKRELSISVGNFEALALLEAALTSSNTVLTRAFWPKLI